MRALLISNSGQPFLHHCRETISSFLAGKRVAFVSAAAYENEAGYFENVREVLGPVQVDVEHLRTEDAPRATLETAQALFVGGGNTYHLLRRLYDANLIETIRARVRDGMPYIGASAGSNITGPNILTTNDWNVDGMKRFAALGLVPFNINPHYVPKPPGDAPFGETRDERIEQYLRVHENPVVGIEEQTWLQCETGDDGAMSARVGGAGRVRLFRHGEKPRDYRAGALVEL